MDMLATIGWCKSQVAALPRELGWPATVASQLDYCEAVISGGADPSKLESLTMGLISVREIDGTFDELASKIRLIDYTLKQDYLSYAAKVRLNIHRKS